MATKSNSILVFGTSRLAKDLSAGLGVFGHAVDFTSAPDAPDKIRAGADAKVKEKRDKEKDKEREKDKGRLDMVVWVQTLPQNPAPLINLTEADWKTHCEDETWAALKTAADIHPRLKSGSCLVFVIPTLAMAGGGGFSASATAGEALRIAAKSLAKLWGQDSIRVYALALAPRHFINPELGEEISKTMSLSDPALGGYGDPKTDIAPVLNLLLDAGAKFWTGATITADGGVWMAQ